MRQRAEEIVADIQEPAQKVLRLNSWVSRHLTTARNNGYFFVARLRATPLQVLQGGGDCADKARLLAAMLREIDIPASMALCFNPQTGQPSHTVVESQPEPGSHMLVDPAYELYYPKPDGQGYYGLLELRKHPERLQERLTYVWETVPRFRPLHWYQPQIASFIGLSTINWRRNRITSLARDLLFLAIGPNVYRLPRPLFLEEPKVAVAGALVVLSLIMLVGHLAIRFSTASDLPHPHVTKKADCHWKPIRSARHQPAAPTGAK